MALRAFAGHPTLPIVTDDIIELTIYSDITHIDITNHTDIQDMSIAALSLLPRLQTVWASGGPITNLGVIMICSAQTITKLDLSKCVFSIATLPLNHSLPPPPPPPPPPGSMIHPPAKAPRLPLRGPLGMLGLHATCFCTLLSVALLNLTEVPPGLPALRNHNLS